MSDPPVSICIIVENLPVPFDRRVWQEARALAESGYRVSVICPRGRGFERKYEVLDGIEIYRHRLWEASGPLGYVAEYGSAVWSEFWLALKVYRRTHFRILHAANPPDTIFLIALFFKIFGVRFIFDHHDLNPELYEAKFGRRGLFYRLVCLAEHMTFKTATVSIATNQSYRNVAITRGGKPPDRVFIVRSCPDLRKVCFRPNPELKNGRPFLVAYVGVMGPQDGLDILLESIDWIVNEAQRNDITFALIGGGTELPRLKALAAQKLLNSYVQFTGRIPDADLAAFLSTADVGVAPDPKNPMNDVSTMNKILEYMAYGKPIVLFDLTEGRRSAGEAALYAKPNDPADFARQVLALLDDEPLRNRLGCEGRKRIEENLNWELEKQNLLSAYKMAQREG